MTGFNFARAVVSIAVFVASAAAAITSREEDWKIALGWNGIVLPADTVGTPVESSDFAAPHGMVKAPSSNTLAVSSTVGKPGGVFICQDVGWGKPCGYSVQPLNVCILLQAPWLNTISSFGPDPGATCFAFASGNCDAGQAQWSFTFPGDNTGGVATSNPWNDKITSFVCVPS
ncbi:hypothetical protein C8F01DRAFT_1259639 [Mycena amicta]|nr:hypothetical protein C8F01DRAFT_1259639 [Mycena amicta]